jgi:hypothetical protein
VSDSVLFYARFGGHIERHSLEYLYFARLNSIHRFNLRQIEKNRFPRKCQCVVCGGHFLCRGIDEYLQRNHVCQGCDLNNKIGRAVGTLFHLVSAIPQWERDRAGIYPNNFLYSRPPRWRQEKMVLPGPAYRGPKIEYWRRKWPSKECRTLFDRCEGHKEAPQLDPKKLGAQPKATGDVIILGSPAKRHANLANTRTAYNEQWPSYTIALMSAGLDAHQRALANDTIARCADLPCAPGLAPEILRRIANNAVNQAPPPSRPKLRLVSGG